MSVAHALVWMPAGLLRSEVRRMWQWLCIREGSLAQVDTFCVVMAPHCPVGLESLELTQGTQLGHSLQSVGRMSVMIMVVRLTTNVVIKNSVPSKHDFQMVRKQGSVLLCGIMWTWKSTVMTPGNRRPWKNLFFLR